MSRARRSAWACHAGMLGIIRKFYTAFGGNCESNHINHLKLTLRDIVGALTAEEANMKVIFGKTVHIIKITDKLTTQVKTNNLKDIDITLHSWQIYINKFLKKQNCYVNAHWIF